MSFQHLWKTVLLNIIFGYSFLFCFMIDDDGSYADNRSKFGHRFPTCLCFAWNAGSVCAVMRTWSATSKVQLRACLFWTRLVQLGTTVTGSCWKKGVMTCATFDQSKVREGKWILEYLATVVQSFGVWMANSATRSVDKQIGEKMWWLGNGGLGLVSMIWGLQLSGCLLGLFWFLLVFF